jgi:hypothetical protein
MCSKPVAITVMHLSGRLRRVTRSEILRDASRQSLRDQLVVCNIGLPGKELYDR